MQALPQRIQDELQAAEALEQADRQARTQAAAPVVNSAADLILPPNPQAAPATPQAAPAPVAPAAPKEDFEHKYRVLQGMYAADVTQLKATVKDLTNHVQSLKARETTQTETKPSVDPKDIEKFGDEMMEMVQRYVTGVAQQLDARIASLEATVNGVTQQTASSAEKAFYTLLTQLVPDWREVNVDERWLAWLGKVDPVYGVARQVALDHAFKSGDAQQVANVFNAFKSSLPVAPPPPSLDSHITPEGAGNPAPPAPVAKPILSERAITAFYNDVSRGKYVGREQEQAAIETSINEAVAEGRVR